MCLNKKNVVVQTPILYSPGGTVILFESFSQLLKSCSLSLLANQVIFGKSGYFSFHIILLLLSEQWINVLGYYRYMYVVLCRVIL